MIKIKSLHLKNFCGYRDTVFDFTIKDQIKPLSIFFGPNGCGKSTALEAIRFLGSARQYEGRENDLVFRKYIYHQDYDPTYTYFQSSAHDMEAKGIFETDDGEKKVIFTNKGFVLNELPSKLLDDGDRQRYEHFYWVDADNPMERRRFQINKQHAESFLDSARSIYGFNCYLEKEVEEKDSTGDIITFYTDFILEKYGTRVHHKRMSAGEAKIATMLSMIFNPLNKDFYSIFLIDNIDQHIYFARHIITLEKLLEHFPDKQIVCTTHSGIIVQEAPSLFLYDVEKYKELENVHAS